jgi:chromate reductase
MNHKKNIFAIVGSASKNSSNLHLIKKIKTETAADLNIEIFDSLHTLPHFDPKLSIANTPQIILDLRNSILQADGILICTPEYIFSIPSGLKNAIEWCVSTTVFSNKPIGIITASASGVKGHEELKLIMKTVDTFFTDETTLLIQGVKSKVDSNGNIIDEKTIKAIESFIESFKELINKV